MLTRPEWLKVKAPGGDRFERVRRTLGRHRLNTVCVEAACPNIRECFEQKTATFLVMGAACTRDCRFCAVAHGRPAPLDPTEPARVADAACELGLEHVVVTSVTRDDLPDGGADHFAATACAIKAASPKAGVEFLMPDFGGQERAQRLVAEAPVEVLAHNMETVPALYAKIRPGADYGRSLTLIRRVKRARPDAAVKSGLMLGLGETPAQLAGALRDMLEAGVDVLTLGQYLRPSKRQIPVVEYVDPDRFAAWRERALEMGFRCVEAGPFVRSSFHALSTWSRWRGGAL